MATLTALKFSTPEGAQQIATLLLDLQKQELVSVVDAAIVSWPVGINIRKTRQLHDLASPDAMEGAFWGMLFGLIFFTPLIGATVGAAMGGLASTFTEVGIDDRFIEQAHAKLTEGTSALFLMADKVALDEVSEAVKCKGLYFELIPAGCPSGSSLFG